MNNKKDNVIEILDRIGFVFLFIFAASLTTSIFVNQIGYYGALLILLIRFAVQNKFEKRKIGLETLFVLLILAEIISAILSENSGQAFYNTFKRAILLPVAYMPVYYVRNEKRFKRITYAFLVFAVLGMTIYLFYAYQYYIHQLYTKEAKGPSLFQYVMTAGGLMSIVTIINVGFLFLKENKLRYKIILIIAILISVMSLISSYTRAAWIGTVVGVIVLFLLHKRWVFVGAVVILIGIFFTLTQTTSQLVTFSIDDSNRKLESFSILNTKGRSHSIDIKNNEIFVADYEAGITKWTLEGTKLNFQQQYLTPSPARGVIVKDTVIYTLLLDSRILILKPAVDSIKLISSIIPKNFVYSFFFHQNYLLLVEGEFGISLIDISNPDRPKFTGRLNLTNENKKVVFTGVSAKENYLYASINDKKFLVIDFSDPANPRVIDEIITEDKPSSITVEENNLIINDGLKGIKVYDVTNPAKPKLYRGIVTKGLPNIIKTENDKIYYTDFAGSIYMIDIHGNVFNLSRFKEKISGFLKHDSIWVASYFHRSRFSSIYDPYHPSNIERINQIKVAFEIFRDNPFFGVGNIDFNELYKKYREPFDKFTYGHLHNNYTHILATLGIFGFIIFIVLIIKIFFIHIETIKISKQKNFYNIFAKGLLASFVGICTSGLFEYNFGDHEIATMIWFTVGMSVTIQKLLKE